MQAARAGPGGNQPTLGVPVNWERLRTAGGMELPAPMRMGVQLGTRKLPDVLVSSLRVMQRPLLTDPPTLCLI